MKRRLWIAGGLALLAVVVLVLLLVPSQGQGHRATVVEAVNQVDAHPRPKDPWQPAAVGMAIYSGGQVRTGAASSARLELLEGMVRLSANSLFTVRESVTRRGRLLTRLFLQDGRLWAHLTTGQPHEFIVETGNAAAAVRDTRFSLRFSDGETLLSVAEGEVELTALGQRVLVVAGQQATVGPRQPPSPPQPMSDEERALWAIEGEMPPLAAPTFTSTATKVPVPTETHTPAPSPTPTYTRSPTPTSTPTQAPTRTPTYTPTETATPTSSPTGTPTPTSTYTVTPTSTPTATPTPTPIPPTTLHVRAYIDGDSQLVVQDSAVRWHHLGAAAPGRLIEADEPTYLNGVAWYPAWPDVPDSENRDCYCDSSTYVGVPPLTRQDQVVSLKVVQARYGVAIIQQPKVANDYTLIVYFDDGPPGGADWYEISLGYMTD
jgi:hypothetical protein